MGKLFFSLSVYNRYERPIRLPAPAVIRVCGGRPRSAKCGAQNVMDISQFSAHPLLLTPPFPAIRLLSNQLAKYLTKTCG